MAQLKNMFIKGKMNLDLDERLIPKGEYRKAQNVLVTNSEDSDVGAIENVKGNELIGDTSLNLGNGVEDTGVCIGSYVDVAKERIFWFITNFTSSQPESGINDIDRAETGSNENCRIVMREKTGTIHVLVNGIFLNLTTTHHITGVNVIGNFLYWTDNYNQPRYIDVELAKGDASYYNCEEKISVAKVAPFLPPFLHNSNEAASNANLGDTYTLVTTNPNSSTQHTKSEYMEEKFIRFAYRYKYSDNTYSIISPFTQSVFKPLSNGELKFGSQAKTGSNSAPGQLAFEPVVSSSVQYVYTHNTVPIMQNAYDKVVMRIPIPTCSDNGIISEHNTTANQISSNSYPNLLKIDSIEILLREAGTGSIKIVDTLDLVNTTGLNFGRYKQKRALGGGHYYRQTVEYTYLARDPFKVLPEKQLVRVGDNAPVRAKAQEVVGSRLVYGNITLGYDLPRDEDNKKGIKFFVTSGPKSENEQTYTADSIGHYFHNHEQYKFHNIKQRRTYQVGIVLVDRYGRTSPVIPSTYKTDNLGDTHTVDAVTADLKSSFTDSNGDTHYSWSDTGFAYGQALSVEFPDSRIVESKKTFDKNERPNGWYSWRIVVKQVEQDYYNVYTQHPMVNWSSNDATTTFGDAGTMTGYRDQHIKGRFTTSNESRSWFSLTNDNINKVPRSIKNFNDEGKDFGERDGFGRLVTNTNEGLTGSEVKLYPKVVQVSNGAIGIANNHFDSVMGDPQQDYINVLSIGSAIDQGLSSLSNAKKDDGNNNANSVQDSGFEDRPRPYSFLADNHKNPLVAEIPNLYNEPVAVQGEFLVSSIGTNSANPPTSTAAADNTNINDAIRTTNNNFANMPFGYPNGKDKGLTVFETKPFESEIDIYFETSSCGLVRDLNEHCDFANQGPTNIKITPTFKETSFTPGLAANILEEAKYSSAAGKNHAQIGALTATTYDPNSQGITITNFEILSCSNGFNDGNDLAKFSIAFEDDKSFVKISTRQANQTDAHNFNLSTGGTVLRLDHKNIRNFTALSTNFIDAAGNLPSAFDTDGFYRVIYYLGQHSSANNNEMIRQCIVVQVVNNQVTNFFGSNLNNVPTNINQQFMLKTNDLFAFQNNNSRDVFNLTLRAIQSNQVTGNENITVTIANSKPTANNHASILVPSTTQPGPGGGKNLATLTAVNGSADPLNNTFGLTSTISGTNGSSFQLQQNGFAPGNFILGASSTFNFAALFGTASNGVYPNSPSIAWQVEDNGGLNSLIAGSIATSITFIGVQVINVLGYHDSISGASACTGVQTQTLTGYAVTKGTATTMYTSSLGLQVGNKVYTNNNLTQTPGAGFIAIAVGGGHKSYPIDASGAITGAGTTCVIV